MKDRIFQDILSGSCRAHLVIAEWLFDLFPSGNEAEVDEGRDADAQDGVPTELIDELKREEEEVYPHSAAMVALV